MEEKVMHEILQKVTFGYAYHKMLLNELDGAEDYIFLDINPAFEEMTGLKREAILGKRMTEVLPGIRIGNLNWLEFYRNVALTGERKRFIQYIESLQRWYKITAFFPEKGYFVTLFQEITEEIQQIKKLEAQKQKIEEMSTELEMVFNGTQDAMFLVRVKDREFCYIRNNAVHQKLTGFSLEDIKGKTPIEVLGKEIGECIINNYQRCVDSKKSITYEETLALPGGKRTWLTTLTPVFEEGRIKYLIGSRKDITLQKKAEAELKKMLKYEKIINSVYQLALQARSLEVLLTESLRLIGEGIGVSRIYLFEVDQEKETVSSTFEWSAPCITPHKEKLREIHRNKFVWWMYRFKNREVINYRDIEDIPDEKTKEILKLQGIKSLLVLPIYLEGSLYGFVGFDDCFKNRVWTEYDINLLNIVANIISSYILHRKYEEIISFLSYHDHLTGLYNRRFMEKEIKRLDTPCHLPISIIIGDINGLKLTNDAFGHNTGDLLLKKAAEIIKSNCRQEDIIARWGGDEFVILLSQTDIKQAEEIVKRIKTKSTLESEMPIQVSIALGYATKTKSEENIWQVLKEAEEWMYRNKLLQNKSYRNGVISSLKTTLFEKSMETEEHAERLKEICIKIGENMGLSQQQLDELELLAILHDIGKVAINERILKKPGTLTEEEWAQMKRHPEIGYRIAQAVSALLPIAEYIFSHHEQWDGKGYPRGLKGKEIPLLSRILAVADAYDAMTNDRVYRKGMSKKDAIAEIKRNAGTQFDPEVVSAFLENCCYSDKIL